MPTQRTQGSWDNISSPDRMKFEERTISDFADVGSRKGFITKVYSLFSAQIAFTVLVTAFIMNNHNLAAFLQQNAKAVSLLSFLGSMGILLPMCSIPRLRYEAPINFLLLAAFTFLQSVVVGTVSSMFESSMVCLAGMHTLTSFLAISLFAISTKYDLTTLGSMLLAASTSLLIGGIANIIFNIPVLNNIMAAFGAILSVGYIAHNTQKIIGGKHHKYSFGAKEYILAALTIYLDAVVLFLRILKILANSKAKSNNSGDEL